MNLSEQQDFDPPPPTSPSNTDKDTFWLLKQFITLAVIIGVIFVAEYVVCSFTRDSALEQLSENGIVRTGEVTGEIITLRIGRAGGSTAYKYCFKVDGDSKYFESSRTPPNYQLFSHKSSTFPVTYLPGDYAVHVFGNFKEGTVDEQSVQYHGKNIVFILWFVKVAALFLAAISLLIVVIAWFRDGRQSQSTSTVNAH